MLPQYLGVMVGSLLFVFFDAFCIRVGPCGFWVRMVLKACDRWPLVL